MSYFRLTTISVLGVISATWQPPISSIIALIIWCSFVLKLTTENWKCWQGKFSKLKNNKNKLIIWVFYIHIKIKN